MKSPYGLDIIESCMSCHERGHYLFCNLPEAAVEMLQEIKTTATYPEGTFLFLEGQTPRGMYSLCQGKARLSTSSPDGKTVTLRIATGGEVLGLSSCFSGHPYDMAVELLEPSQANFVARKDFLRLLEQHREVAVRVAEQLSRNYHTACLQIRSLGLSRTASEKLARLVLEWSSHPGEHADRVTDVEVTLTHEEFAQLIGTSRETVTRMLADFKKRKLIEIRGSTLIVRDQPALVRMVQGTSQAS